MNQRFERFTGRARKVLTLAHEEAHRLQHDFIGTEHILLGLISEGEGLAAKTLLNLGIEPDKVRSEIERIVGRGKKTVTGEISLTPRSKKVIELAVDEARRLNHQYIGTEHLLLGLVREGEGVAADVLESFGVSLEKVRKQILVLLGEMDNPAFSKRLPAPASLLLRKGRKWLAKQKKRPVRKSWSEYCCSFCGKPRNEVERLVAGPNHIYICNECVELCRTIVREGKEE